jgi:hypothetical protein
LLKATGWTQDLEKEMQAAAAVDGEPSNMTLEDVKRYYE